MQNSNPSSRWRPLGVGVAAVVVGAVVAVIVVSAIEWIDLALYPMTSDFEAMDELAFAEMVSAMPIAAKLIVTFGWFLGSFAGAWAANRISDRAWLGWIVAAFVAAGGIANVIEIPHPLWMQVCAVALPFLGGLAAYLVRRT